MTEQDRYGRQNLLVPPDKISEVNALVVGVGSIGRQVALQLAGIGVPRMTLVDMDRVEVTNISSQGFGEITTGQHKVFATQVDCKVINSDMDVEIHRRPFRSCDKGTHVFSCVDSMETRKEIFEETERERLFFVDGRTGGENIRVLTAYDYDSLEHWENTWFPNEEADNLPCAARSTIYCANIAAGIMVSQFTKFLRKFWIPKDLSFSLLGMEIQHEIETQPDGKELNVWI